MTSIKLSYVSKVYDGKITAVDDLSLAVQDGEFLVLVGPSGCGKSTTLRLIAGLEKLTAGTISIGDRVVNDVPPKDRDIAMVFQNYALYPHMTVAQNLAFALRMRKVPRAERERRVRAVADTLGIVELLERKPKALSGGQQQRVALGRALVREPAVFLFDEPLSNLDAKLRLGMRTEIRALQRRVATTAVYVTHDQEEAMILGDRVAVLCDGRLQQVGTPRDVYHAPANRFVATFIGAPAMNVIEGRLEGDAGRLQFVEDGAGRGAGAALPLPEPLATRLATHAGEPVGLGIRPTAFRRRARDANGASLAVDIDVVELLGDVSDHVGRTPGGQPLVVRLPSSERDEPATLRLEPDTDRIALFAPGRFGRNLLA
jgi:multiple sugar transport system ATP-binding protein